MLTATPPIEYIHFPFHENETIGFGPEAEEVRKNLFEAAIHMAHPISRQSKMERFSILSDTWENDSKYSSSANDLLRNPSYLEIISMGKDALPFIFEDLRKYPRHWFVALRIITGFDPVPYDKKGNVAEMTRIWLIWAKQNGYIS
ncbi:MAG: hypothetical protein ACD_81C00106G0004 [uncultured bacterium]|uniref:Uncharacterized protein n=1 Tax=Candidatus Wolfebacteria bacterium GW2011_GWE2_44_13 TaxID=1619017 RepID=A0A0G1JHU4_9BACT|nr:MAG: hypothetical protein ACD_81C00106G0004 [uncultured bacterium]KKT43572.1 MAG: hypothetical protein UW32_C0001G0164 [Candidatus Wolfebacteria bacterium GW2011_GWE2_44_13]